MKDLNFTAGLWQLFNEWRFYDRFAVARERSQPGTGRIDFPALARLLATVTSNPRNEGAIT